MEWWEVRKAARECAAHALIFTFTLFLVLKLHHLISSSWWIVFSPLWLFHIVVARGRFSIPAPSHLDAPPWSPFHVVVAMPLLIAFELLLCIHLESSYVNHVAAVNLNIVFLPVYFLETIVIIDNLRVTNQEFLLQMQVIFVEEKLYASVRRKKLLELYDSSIDEVHYRLDSHRSTILPMVLILGATVFMVQMINGNIVEQDFWFLYMIFSIGQFFAYASSVLQNGYQNFAGLRTVGHVMMVPILGFQVLLCMYLQGTPAIFREIPIPYIFSPLFLLQGVGVVFSTSQLVETTLLLLKHGEDVSGRYFKLSSRARAFLELMRHGPGFIGWWSLDEISKQAQAQRIHCTLAQETRDEGCSTFCAINPPDLVKKMSKKELVEEALNLQGAINKQMTVTEYTRQQYEWLRYKKILCRVCFEKEIEVVLLPCGHRILCSRCCWERSTCPYCSAYIRERMHISS